MKQRFDATQGLIFVPVKISGPGGTAKLLLALDTGATSTLIAPFHLEAIGYDLGLGQDRVQVTTGSGVEFVVRLRVARISALGRSRRNFPVLGHTLPPSATVDGLLGLDFFRRCRLEIDFRRGSIQLAA